MGTREKEAWGWVQAAARQRGGGRGVSARLAVPKEKLDLSCLSSLGSGLRDMSDMTMAHAVGPLAAPQAKSAETAARGAEEAVPQIRRAQRGHGGF